MSARQACRVILLVGAMAICSLTSRAQSTYGSIQGVVSDSSGAAIPSARVTLNNKSTGETQVVATGDAGLYSFVNLAPGDYEVDAEKSGFKRVSEDNVTVQVQQSTRADILLPVGEASETITVSSQTPLLQPETSSLGQVVETRMNCL
jgi:hypothetical protein